MVPCDDIDVLNAKRIPIEDSVICGSNVKYTCNEGFTLHGDSVLECGAGGELLGQVPVCRNPGNILIFLKRKFRKLTKSDTFTCEN